MSSELIGNIGKTTLAVYVGVVLCLGVTTFLSPLVYGSWWFILLWIIFAATLAIGMWQSGMWRRPGSFLLHLSMLAILGGGLLTWLMQEKGSVRISQGERVAFFEREGGGMTSLPKELSLERFEVVYYPGGDVPRDYVSHLLVDGERHTVSMNKILDIDGYRLCQSSYDNTGATVLSVNHDPYGIPLSYAGYVLFGIGGFLVMLNPAGRFRRLLKVLSVITILLIPLGVSAATQNKEANDRIYGVPRALADSLRKEQVIYGGRIVTFNTLAKDVMTKLYGDTEYRGLSAEQVLLSFRIFPQEWKDQPLVKIKDKNLRQALDLDGEYASLSDFFDEDGGYRISELQSALGEGHRRSVEEIDEKVGILLTLLSGNLIVKTSDKDISLAPWRIELELLYNSFPGGILVFVSLFMAFLSFGVGILFVRYEKISGWIGALFLVLSFVLSLLIFVVQWILASRLPLSNTYETLEFIVLLLEVLLLTVGRRIGMLLLTGSLFSGVLALVAHLVEINPVVTPLMPVLHSPWLSLHVSLVMASYVLLGFTAVVAVVALSGLGAVERLRGLSLAMLYPGVWLLGMGIFTGAVWANVSWGEYWSWDPKETWALVTLMVYSLPLHDRMFAIILKPIYGIAERDYSAKIFHIYLLIAILSLIMTYVGVNYLNSLHAYN